MNETVIDQTLDNVERLVDENAISEVFVLDEDKKELLSRDVNISLGLMFPNGRSVESNRIVIYRMNNGSTLVVGIDKIKNKVSRIFAFNKEKSKEVRFAFDYDDEPETHDFNKGQEPLVDIKDTRRREIWTVEHLMGIVNIVYESKTTGEVVYEEYINNLRNYLIGDDRKKEFENSGGKFCIAYDRGMPSSITFYSNEHKLMPLKGNIKEYMKLLQLEYNNLNLELENILSTSYAYGKKQ